jgi:hypothetical protein
MMANDGVLARPNWRLTEAGRIDNGVRDTVARFDDEQSALAALYALQDEQSTLADHARAANERQAERELALLPEKFAAQTADLLTAQRHEREALQQQQDDERKRVSAPRPVNTDRFEVVEF